MSTPLDPLPADSYAQFAAEAQPVVQTIDPDDPPWGVGAAAFTWFASIALLLVATIIAVAIYFLTVGVREAAEVERASQNDPRLILFGLVMMIPAQAATLVVVWIIVTAFGKRPFWRTVGWSWSPRVGFWSSAGLGVLMFLLGGVIIEYFGRDVKTPLEDMLESSAQARFVTAFLALAGAPLVEELVYRGVLYPALQRAIGALWAVLVVATLFTLVHYEQYYNDPAVLGAVGGLSLVLTIVRARTGRLLPCFVIHFVFNGIQCVLLILDYFHLLPRTGETQAGLAALCAQLFASAFPIL